MSRYTSPTPFTFKHQRLGEIIGLTRGNDVVQFRGIPFAKLSARFRQSSMRVSLPHQPFDATKAGPICPQSSTLSFPKFWSGSPAPDGLMISEPSGDEFECLNLCISAPRSTLNGDKKLPVFVYIHGGAFLCGSQSIQISGREVWDGVNPVRSSLGRSDGIIVVTINYRVGPLGFLASSELADYNNSFNEPVGNYGLHDQKTALDWVSTYIHEFGGDAENITIQGGSAGGASCHYQAIFPQNKLKRAILSSGTVLLGSLPMEQHQTKFDLFARKYNAVSQDEKVSKLQAVPVNEFVEEVIGAYCPVIDGFWILGRSIRATVELPSPPDLIIGSCTYEQDATLAGLREALNAPGSTDNSFRDTIKSMAEVLGIITDESRIFGEQLLKTYDLENFFGNPTENLEIWAEFLADLMFRIPPIITAQHYHRSKVFLYEFQGTNPFHGWPLGYGKANHAISDVFFFNAAGDLVDQKHQEEYQGAVDELQGAWIDFCYGKDPWKPFNDDETRAIGPIRTIENYGKGRLYNTLEEIVGDKVAYRWRTALELSN